MTISISIIRLNVFALVGTCLCIGVPLLSIGPTFIIWPTLSEISGVILFALALYHLFYKRTFIVPKFISNLFYASIIYTFIITIVITVLYSYEVVYPIWSLFRTLQWAFIIIFFLYAPNNYLLVQLIKGVFAGMILNSILCYCQRLGLQPVNVLSSFIDLENSGPWKPMIEKEGIVFIESIGVFSYSRIATGFFLALSPIFIDLLVVSKSRRNLLYILCMGALISTGSRLGIMSAFAIIACTWLKHPTKLVLMSAGILSIITGLMLFASEDFLNENIWLGRLLGYGESYGTGIDERNDRQLIVFKLPIHFILFGCGIGNLGSALNLYEFKFYTAHGFFFQALSNIGVIGSCMLLLLVVLIAYSYKLTFKSIGLFVALLLCAFADDFMMPTAQSGHIPLIVALAFIITTKQGQSLFQPPKFTIN